MPVHTIPTAQLVLLTLLGVGLPAVELDCPLHPEEVPIAHAIVAAEGVDVEVSEPPSWLANRITQELAGLGIDAEAIELWGFRDREATQRTLTFAYDADGRTLAIHGNGPWLGNRALRALAGMPELRSIAIGHNVRPELGWDHPRYDGTGFAALIDSRLVAVAIGHGFNGDGLAQLAQIASLHRISVSHSRVRQEDLAVLHGRAGITELRLAEMGQLGASALAVFASLPDLTHLRFNEAYLTWDDGLEHLDPRAGQLEVIDLRMCVIDPDASTRLRTNHPDAEILTDTPETIAKRHFERTGGAKAPPAKGPTRLKIVR